MSHENQLIKAVIDKLKADVNVTALISSYDGSPSVFTHVPQDLDEDYPWITIYGVESNQFDNDATLGFSGTMTVHSWSVERSMKPINDLKTAIYNALHNQSFTYTGYCEVEFCQEFTTTLRDPDGITLHGVQRFKFIMQED